MNYPIKTAVVTGAARGIGSAVASYKMKREFPADLVKALPAPEEFEKFLREEE